MGWTGLPQAQDTTCVSMCQADSPQRPQWADLAPPAPSPDCTLNASLAGRSDDQLVVPLGSVSPSAYGHSLIAWVD